MKQFNGYAEAKKAARYTGGRLPEGAYICKILNVKYNNSTDSAKSDAIEVSFDISEGDQKDFYKLQYQNSQQEDKKWKGRMFVYVPMDDGSEKDEWTKERFAKWTNSLEDSNSGYVWDWHEEKWIGKTVGIVFGTTGTVIEGKEITYTEARFPCSVDEVRNGKAPKATFKAKNGYTGKQQSSGSAPQATGNEPWMTADSEESALPFNV